MRKFGKSLITFTIVLSPIFIMGRPIVGRVEEDYYRILGLNENSSPDDVLQAFYALSENFNFDEPNAQLKFQKIREAYEVLSDVETRRQYDYRRRLGGNFQTTMNFGYPNANVFAGNYPFGQQFADGTGGTGGNAYAWTSGNMPGANNYGWGGANGWNVGNGFNNNNGWGTGNGMNNAYAWGQGGSGGGSYGGGGGGGGSGKPSGGGNYAWGTGTGGAAWVVGGADNGATAFASGGSGSSAATGGRGAAAAVSGGAGGDVSYESYTINGCTTVIKRNGDSVAQYTTCD